MAKLTAILAGHLLPPVSAARRRRPRFDAVLACAAVTVGFVAIRAVPAVAAVLEPRAITEQCRTGSSGWVPGCLSVTFYPRPLAQGQQQVERIQCPPAKPYFWNWAARVSAGMHATLIGVLKDAKDRDIGAIVNLHEQTGDSVGESRLFLGCSSSTPKLVGRMTQHGYHPNEQR